MTLDVLVTSAGSAVAQGIIKSIKGSSLDCRIITTDAQPYSAGLYRGEAAYLVPLAKDANYIDSIIDICKKENIQAILIGLDYELLKLSENKDLIEKETGTKIVVSPPEIIKISNDKWLTYEFLKSNRFHYIPSVLYQDIDKLIEQEDFPLIIKPRVSDSSKNTFIVNNREELNKRLDFLLENSADNLWLSQKVDPIIQKYIGTEKDEFTSTTLVFDNRCYGSISMKREMRFGGHTTKAEIDDFPEINEYIKKVAERLNPFGPCNFQSRINDGIPYIFEINCRYSGTTATCALADFNTVEACLRRVVLKEDMKDLSYKKGVMLRYFNEVFVPIEDVDELKAKGSLQNPRSEINKNL